MPSSSAKRRFAPCFRSPASPTISRSSTRRRSSTDRCSRARPDRPAASALQPGRADAEERSADAEDARAAVVSGGPVAHRAQPRKRESDGPRRRRSGARPQGGLGTAARPVGAACGQRGEARSAGRAGRTVRRSDVGARPCNCRRRRLGRQAAADTGQHASSALGGTDHVFAATDQRHRRLRRAAGSAASHRQLERASDRSLRGVAHRRFTTCVSRRSGPSFRP